MTESLTLKWGTLKGWDLKSEAALAALDKWSSHGVPLSAVTHHPTPEQTEALCALIDVVDGPIWNDWTGELLTKEQARDYLRRYGDD